MKKLNHIESAIKEGYSLHTFRSGSGLRVATLKYNDVTKYYGESCDLNEALRILNDDVRAGGREYKDVYNGKVEQHYYTGSYGSDTDKLDLWVCNSKPLDITFEENNFVIKMNTFEDIKTPEIILNKIFKNKETVYWKVPGGKRIFKSYPQRLANREIACCTGTIPSRSGAEANDEMIEVTRIAKGTTLSAAFDEAIKNTDVKLEIEWYQLPYDESMEHELTEQLNKL
ncbi:MAG: hypothetical protein WC979_03080 [Candidatus Pacearchaeota archaeon]|jgi:hypothetical protein|nr:hypothetical protein [Clostridia bacterium]